MKKNTFFLTLVLSLFVLTLTLTGCEFIIGDSGNTEPVLDEYEYKFTLGKGDDAVDIAYVLKTSYTESQDSTNFELYAKVNDTLISSRIANGSFSGKEGVVHINGIWELKLKNGKLTPSTESTSYGIIQDYTAYAGNYVLNEESVVDEVLELQDTDLNLTLNADGTGSFIDKALTYFPLNGESIVIFEEDDDEDGLVIDINRSSMTHNPTHDRLTFNFVRGTNFANYYKIFFDIEGRKMRNGEGFFRDSILYTNDTHFVMSGSRWVIGRYELKGSVMSVIYEGEDDHKSVNLTATDTDFDYERATTHISTDGTKRIYIYKNGLAFSSHEGTTYELAKGTEGLDVIAVSTENTQGEKWVLVFDKETLDVAFRLAGDTYVDISTYDKYEDIANEYSSDLVRNLYISPDGENMFMSHHYPQSNEPIEYYDMKSKTMGYANMKVEDKIIISQYRYYFLTDGKFIDVNAGDNPYFEGLLNSATDSTISTMPVKTKMHFSNNSTPHETEYSAYVAKITVDDSTRRVIYVLLTTFETGGNYATYHCGKTLATDVNGLTIMLETDGYFTLIKDISGTLNVVTYELDFNVSALKYYGYEDGHAIIRNEYSDTYYLINDTNLAFDYAIIDDNYDGIKDAEIISMAGAENVKAEHYYYGDIILSGDSKIYVPSDSIWYLNCIVYVPYECTVYENLTTGRVIKYVKDGDTTIYLFVNEDGHYEFGIGEGFDPDGLATFEKLGEIIVYENATMYGENIKLEITEYKHPSGEKYMLAVGYVLYDYIDTGNTISGSFVMTYVFTFGPVTETANGYVIAGIDNYVYTITIDGTNVTVIQTANI